MFKNIKTFYRFFSRNFLTQKRVSKIISLQLLLLGIFAGFLFPGASAYANAHALSQLSTAQFTPVETATLTGLQFPLPDYSISQTFSFAHPGIDLQARPRTPIWPITEGEVKEVNRGFAGYGQSIIVSHRNGLQSLYAHLSTIEVKVGDRVERNTTIGRVGSTGWATGNHLHLEIWQNGKPLNPLEVLGEK